MACALNAPGRRQEPDLLPPFPPDTGPGGGCLGHLHVHAGGVEGAVPVHGQEFHPADLLLLLGFLEVRLQHAQGNAPEVVHWEREQTLN